MGGPCIVVRVKGKHSLVGTNERYRKLFFTNISIRWSWNDANGKSIGGPRGTVRVKGKHSVVGTGVGVSRAFSASTFVPSSCPAGGEEYRAVPEQWFRSAGIAVHARPCIFVLQLLRCFPRRAPYSYALSRKRKKPRAGLSSDKIISVFTPLSRLVVLLSPPQAASSLLGV